VSTAGCRAKKGICDLHPCRKGGRAQAQLLRAACCCCVLAAACMFWKLGVIRSLLRHRLNPVCALLRACCRWHNHLNPDIKRGQWTRPEDEIIVRFHRRFGNQVGVRQAEEGATGVQLSSAVQQVQWRQQET
jgi:hypothetical protein